MLKKTITYTDFNDVERKEDFYFNLSKAELVEMELGTAGGFGVMMDRVIAAQDTPTLMAIFKDIIMKAYGEKSADGRRFIKSKELSEAFTQTGAYSVLVMEMLKDSKKAAEFFNSIVPANMEETQPAKLV